MGTLFGTDGIRGVANQYPMTAEMAIRIGRAVAYFFKKPGHIPIILLGKDTRLSGDMLECALVAGICSLGANAAAAGVLPTPGVAFLSRNHAMDAGIVISASHNPFEDNGMKIFDCQGNKLTLEQEAILEELILADDSPIRHPASYDIGRMSSLDRAAEQYMDFLIQTVPATMNLQGTRIVLDCAQGATSGVAPQTFRRLGADVTVLCNSPDGRNINHQCGSQYPEALARTVVEQKAAIGFAFDGDGDRVIAVDEKGFVLTGDQMLAVCAASLKREGRLSNNLVVRTIMSNIGLSVAFDSLGIDSVMTDVGDREVLQEMRTRGSIIGGEDSGHLIFLNHHTTGDGLITALQLLTVMMKEGTPLSTLASIMKIYPQSLINVAVKKREDRVTAPAILEVVQEVEHKLGTEGRVLVRYSGTQNLCRVMVEGPTAALTDHYCRQIARVVREQLV